MTLRAVQRGIASDWQKLYKRVFGEAPTDEEVACSATSALAFTVSDVRRAPSQRTRTLSLPLLPDRASLLFGGQVLRPDFGVGRNHSRTRTSLLLSDQQMVIA
jgi:hypothetical protein